MVTIQSTITISYHDLITATTALDVLARKLGPEDGAPYEELRSRLHRLFEEHEELVEDLHPDAQIPDSIYSPDPDDFSEEVPTHD